MFLSDASMPNDFLNHSNTKCNLPRSDEYRLFPVDLNPFDDLQITQLILDGQFVPDKQPALQLCKEITGKCEHGATQSGAVLSLHAYGK